MSALGEVVKKVKPYFLMVFLQFGFAGMYLISVASLKKGMNHYVLVVYRNVVAAAFMAPLAFWFERKVRPRMTLPCFLKITLLGLLEPVLDQNFYYMGVKLTSASFSSALYNILPAITFVIAVLLRMEKIELKNVRSQAKIIGTLVTVAGALVMILYRGPIWINGYSHHDSVGTQEGVKFFKGTLMLVFSCFCWSCFFILQSHTLRVYPAAMSLTVWICFMGAVESAAVTFVMERGHTKVWSIGWDMNLATAVYSGVMCSGVAYYVQGMVMKERGPVFVTAFNPLCMIIVAALGSALLAEEISLGRLIGAVIIVIGLYSLIWGKSKDYIVQSDEKNEKTSTIQLPISVNETGKGSPY